MLTRFTKPALVQTLFGFFPGLQTELPEEMANAGEIIELREGKSILNAGQNFNLNTSREVVSRLLKKLEQRGMIIMHRNAIEILKTEPVNP